MCVCVNFLSKCNIFSPILLYIIYLNISSYLIPETKLTYFRFTCDSHVFEFTIDSGIAGILIVEKQGPFVTLGDYFLAHSRRIALHIVLPLTKIVRSSANSKHRTGEYI